MSPLENTVHSLVQRMFPFQVAGGWAYRGFSMRRDDGRIAIDLRFEKKLRDRRAFCVLHIFAETIGIGGFDLKSWILDKLQEQENALLTSHRAEFAGVA